MGGGRGARDGGYLKNLTSNKYLDRGGAFCLGAFCPGGGAFCPKLHKQGAFSPGGILSGGGGILSVQLL